MLFNSPEFLFIFLPIAWIGYRLAARYSSVLILYWMVGASLLFYAIDAFQFLPIFLASVAINFSIALLIAARRRTAGTGAIVGLGVAANLLLIAIFKYAAFGAEVFSEATGIDMGPIAIALPIGISFYTFQQIAYIVDVHRGADPERNPVRYILFVSFFPHLIAGPLVYRHELLPQLDHPDRDFLRNIASGGSLFIIGLFKKVVIADWIAGPSSLIFGAAAAGAEPTLVDAWLAALSYTFQIYFDFSAYSDMAIGLGRMFGLEIPVNFASPYKARSIIDFWRRWHITLSRLLRDYLYVSLGGSRHGPLRRHANLMITMLLGGLWHGAGWPFIAWGALHGGYLWINHAWRSTALSARWAGSRLWMVVAQALTFIAVVIAWVPFRAHDFDTAARIWSGMIGLNGIAFPGKKGVEAASSWLGQALGALPVPTIEASGSWWLLLLVLGLICWIMPNSGEIMSRGNLGTPSRGYPATMITSPRFFHWRPSLAWAVLLGVAFAISLLKLNDVSEFLYFRF